MVCSHDCKCASPTVLYSRHQCLFFDITHVKFDITYIQNQGFHWVLKNISRFFKIYFFNFENFLKTLKIIVVQGILLMGSGAPNVPINFDITSKAKNKHCFQHMGSILKCVPEIRRCRLRSQLEYPLLREGALVASRCGESVLSVFPS